MSVSKIIQQLADTARAMVAPPKGILAADESIPTIEKRFQKLGIPCTPETRRSYREILFTAEGIGEFISSVILYDETIRDKISDGRSFVEVLQTQDVIPGIKVDKGTKTLAGSPEEKVTEGLDGLRERLAEYREMGARFAKWRAVITIIGDTYPTPYCIEVNAHALARYAALCQEAGLVPIVEPEVLLDGDHTLARCEKVSSDTLRAVFNELKRQGVRLEGIVLKPSMVLAGKDASIQPSVKEVAEATLRVFRAVIPREVPGVAFLSGGQDDVLATERLNEMNKMGPHPWQVTFSFSRGLQNPALAAWQGKPENAVAAQKVFLHRARLNSAARMGQYTSDMEKES